VDTFAKDGRRLFDHVAEEQLASRCRTVHDAGLLFAIAGSLRSEDLSRAAAVGPDVVAVRTAACRGGTRTGNVSEDAVRRLKAALQECA
jgi:(5-formylfuran-3-yl)methyl phosphate synthase